MTKFYVVAGLLLTLVFSVSIVTCAKLTSIDPGHVGVSVKKCGGGKVSPDPIPVGYYWRELFCENVIEYPTSMQNLILTKHEGEGSNFDDDITVTSSEGLNINMDVSLNFTLDPKQVPAIYERFRAPVEDIMHKYIRQTVREALQATFAGFTAEELYSTKKEIARINTEKYLTNKLSSMGFIVVQFTIARLEPPKQVVDSINAKMSMVQEAQRAQQEVAKKTAEAQQLEAQAQGEANAMKARAAGEAEAITLKAEAQAKANKLLADSVTPALIQYETMRKWNGFLPQVTSGGVPFINLTK
jgi:regulator of protease activity HflC (stomatin/prohibitin superfamily)